MAIKTYSPERVDSSWAGIIDFTGFAEGTAITIRRNTDNSAQTVGIQGDVAKTKTANRTGQVEMVFHQNADINRILAAIQRLQDLPTSDLMEGDIVVSDPSGGMLAIAKNCHIMTPPEMALSDDQSPKTWVWFSDEVEFLDLPAGVTDSANLAARIDAAVSAFQARQLL